MQIRSTADASPQLLALRLSEPFPLIDLGRIRFKDTGTDKTLAFLTNQFALPAAPWAAIHPVIMTWRGNCGSHKPCTGSKRAESLAGSVLIMRSGRFGHKFGDLTGSDKAGFELKDKTGTTVMKFYMDYVTSSSTQDPLDGYTSYSGFRSLGVTGGDGSSISMGARPICTTSTARSS